MYLVSFHISYEFEYFYQWIKTFYGFEGLQGTHMDALNPFKVCEPFRRFQHFVAAGSLKIPGTYDGLFGGFGL